MKNVLLLGATGSIGESVLSVISQNKESLNLFGISLNKNILKSQEILKEYSPDYVYSVYLVRRVQKMLNV